MVLLLLKSSKSIKLFITVFPPEITIISRAPETPPQATNYDWSVSSSLKVSHPSNNVANCTLQKGGILPCTRARFNQYISASPSSSSSSRLACQLLQLPVAVTIPPSPHPLHRGGKDGEMIYFCRLEPVAFGCNRLQVDIAGAFACAHYCLQGLFFFLRRDSVICNSYSQRVEGHCEKWSREF